MLSSLPDRTPLDAPWHNDRLAAIDALLNAKREEAAARAADHIRAALKETSVFLAPAMEDELNALRDTMATLAKLIAAGGDLQALVR